MIINPAGGLVYHFRALRFRNSLWAPFRRIVGQWISDWQCPERKLIVIGPSAGYSIPVGFLERFDEIIGVEPDPLARILFARRCVRSKVSWWGEDVFARGPEGLRTLLDKNPDAAVLFSNVLGQLGLILDSDESSPRILRWKRELFQLLCGRSWLSYHDRFSGAIPVDFSMPVQKNTRLSDEQAVAELLGTGRSGEWTDHGTEGFFPDGLEHFYFHWQLRPDRWHVIEGVRGVRS